MAVPARLILGAFSTTSSYIPEMVAPLRAAAAVVRRRAVTLHPAEGSSSGSSAAAGGGGAGAGGVSTRDAPLFGRGFCTQSSRSGGSYTPPGRSWRTFRRWRQCFDPARQMRRRRMGSRATTSPSRRSCNIGSRSFESYGCTWRLFGLEIRAAGSCARRYPARLSRLFLGPGPGSCPWYRLPAAVCHIQCGGTSKARSRCILDRPNLHPGDGGSPPGGGGGGGPARGRGLIQQRGPIGQQLNGRRRRRRRRGVSTRDAPLFGCGFCIQSSRSGGLGPPPRRSWRTLRLWRQCFNPARQARRH